jgi:glutamyl-Q tRNA(Asp) synthetase
MAFVTRFAPSPTGPLHLGHAYSAILAHDMARAVGGRFLLRIEDIDRARARPEWEAQIYDDLTWLGLHWETPILRQSDQLSSYKTALQDLWQRGCLYPCSCNRRDIEAALTAPQEGDPLPRGPDGLIYPGTCRPKGSVPPTGPMPEDAALRLNLSALEALGFPSDWTTCFTETGPDHAGQITTTAAEYHAQIGDILLARRDMGTSYHLSVVLDDAAQGVTQVTRGADLFEATRIHVLLQRLLALPVPQYHHHRLIRDEAGKRLAKRDDARALAKYRADGASPADIRRLVGL